jgi:AcrR family transcriptional regulator
MINKPELADRILDTAIEFAKANSWEAVKLHEIADQLEISLDDIRRIYPQKDDLVEAWFDRADSAAITRSKTSEFSKQSARTRLHKVMMDWFLSMQGYRSVTREMLCYKLEFGHVHLQVLGILRISRTVQWFREAALLKSTNLKRIAEEVCISSIFVSAFLRWLVDRSEDSKHTSRFLQRALRHVHSLD